MDLPLLDVARPHEPTLLVLRGNSGSGKSTIAREVRARSDCAIALVGQDYLRRTVLREADAPGALNIRLIDQVARFALSNGHSVIVEGILKASRYGDMLRQLRRDFEGPSHVVYLDVPLDETLRRHSSRPQAADFTAEEMSGWHLPGDLLGDPDEHRLEHPMSIDAVVEYLLDLTRWGE